MTYTTVGISDFLAVTSPFDSLSPAARERLSAKLQPLRYRMGQAIVVRETMPAEIAILYEGQARLLGYAPGASAPVTLQLLKPGEVLGWVSLLREVACETAIASTEATCLTLGAADFLALLEQEIAFAEAFRNRCTLIEVFDLLGAELEQRASGTANLNPLALKAIDAAVILNLPPGKTPLQQLDPNLVWLLSGGAKTNFAIGSRLTAQGNQTHIQVESPGHARLLGLPEPSLLNCGSQQPEISPTVTTSEVDIPYAPERPPQLESASGQTRQTKYPYVHARGPLDATLACFSMLSQHLGMPFKRDVIKRTLTNSRERTGSISLQLCGAVAELMGLSSQLVDVPAIAVSRLPGLCRKYFLATNDRCRSYFLKHSRQRLLR